MASTPTFGDDVGTAGNDTLDGLAGASDPTRRLEAPEFTRLTLWCLVSVIEDLSQFARRPRGRAAIAVLAIVGLVSLLGWFGTVKAPPEPGQNAHDAGPAGMPLPTAA